MPSHETDARLPSADGASSRRFATTELGVGLAAALRSRADELREAAKLDMSFPARELRAEVEGTARALEGRLGRVTERLAGRRPVCADDQWAALMLPSNQVAGGARSIAALLAG